jgi:hypothetical protein
MAAELWLQSFKGKVPMKSHRSPLSRRQFLRQAAAGATLQKLESK